MPQYPPAVSLRAAGHRGGGPGGVAPVRPQGQRVTKPSAANQVPFEAAVAEVSEAVTRLLGALVTSATPRNREVEAAKARARFANRRPA